MGSDTPYLDDAAVPAAAILLGPAAGEFLEALISEAGDTVESYRAVQVRYVPAKSITVQFLVNVDRGEANGLEQVTVVAASGLELPEGVPVMRSEAAEIAVWRFPHDPFLPGLPAATDRGRAGELLERLGASLGDVRIRTRAYRPGRRAVVEVTTTSARIYMKVLRPERVANLQEKHVALAAHLPVPHSFGWSRDLGIVALEAMPGVTLRNAIEGGAAELPGPSQLGELLSRFPEVGAENRVRGAWERAASHARTLHAVVPDASGQISRIAQELATTESDEPVMPVHGDFHASQIMVHAGAVAGLVDVDTAGVGHRSDDLANILGHLATVATISSNATALQRYGARLIHHFDDLVPPSMLRRKIAATIFGLASGPFRVQEPDWPAATRKRLDLAERWLESARDVRP